MTYIFRIFSILIAFVIHLKAFLFFCNNFRRKNNKYNFLIIFIIYTYTKFSPEHKVSQILLTFCLWTQIYNTKILFYLLQV